MKSPSPVIMTGLMHAVPAEVPPTTAPRRYASSIALPTGVSPRATTMRRWSPPAKKIPPAFPTSSTSAFLCASNRFLTSSPATFEAPNDASSLR